MTKTNVQSTPSNSQHHDTPNSKTHVIKFRVTAEEKASLELTCKLLNLSLSTFIRRAIANLDIAHADNMKFVLMAFDEGTGLTPHRAPGNAILTALEGKAIIGYEGKDYELNAGESFRFDKNGLHSVTAQGKFKMSLLLVIE